MARKKSSKNYFTAETEEYIVKYNNSIDTTYRAQIFTDYIYYPFYKLAENIIHTFKFYYTDGGSVEDLKHEVVSMLLEEKIMKFDSENGAKAYSYFGTIVKRWLINYNNKNYKKLKQIGSFDDIEESFEDASDITLSRGITLSQFMEIWVESMYSNLDIVFTKTSEKRIADAVLTIFKTRHDLDIFKKKALYIYIREMTDCETPHLTRVVSTLKEDFYKLHQKYHNAGRLLIKEE
tara:strand:+ start:2564 stop:3268 length:705 start_codon:yes stop_codon:yes gene_type:complete